MALPLLNLKKRYAYYSTLTQILSMLVGREHKKPVKIMCEIYHHRLDFVAGIIESIPKIVKCIYDHI